MITNLPARVDPAPGESLESWLDRIANENLVKPSLLRELPHSQIASVTGFTVERLKAMTLRVYPRSLTEGQLTWNANAAGWVCPSCTPLTGVHLLVWQLALHPVCQACGCLLATPPELETQPVHPDLLTVCAELGSAATRSGSRVDLERILIRLRATALLVSLTMDDAWPPRQVPAPPVPPAELPPKRPRSTPTPTVAAALIASIGTHLDGARLLGLAREGWERVRQDQWAATRARALKALLPHEPHDPPTAALHGSLDPDELEGLRKAIQKLAREHGLAAEHAEVVKSNETSQAF